MKVLIVEDDPVTRHVLHTMVTKWGHDAAVAANGDEACHWLDQNTNVSAVIAVVDWMMPGISGPQFCQMLSSRPDAERFYTILFTSRTGEDDHHIGDLSGADAHLAKSTDFQALKRQLGQGAGVLESRMKQLGKPWLWSRSPGA